MKRIRTLSVFLGLVLFMSIISVYGQVASPTLNQVSEKEFVTDDITIKVPTDDVPFFYYWETGDDSITYRVQFDSMFEVIDSNDNGLFDQDSEQVVSQSYVALAQMDWSMSEIHETNSEIAFNLTGSYLNLPTIDSDLVIKFRNHILKGETNELKFDVVINNYEWTDDSETTILVLGFKIQTADPIYEDEPELDNDRAQFGQGYMDIVNQASNVSGSELSSNIKASLAVGSSTTGSDSDSRVFLSYTHFSGDLIHDPTLGIDQIETKEFVADELTIKTPTSQVPFYFFWRTSEPDTTYRVQFDAMFEVKDANGDDKFNPESETVVSQSIIALAQMEWSMSEIVNESDADGTVTAYHFNLTGSYLNIPMVDNDLEIKFRNHISVEGGSSNLKFDFVVNNYNWTDDSEDVLLVLAYKVQTTDESYEGEPEGDENSAVIGNAYFNASDEAVAEKGDVSDQVLAQLSTGMGDATGASSDDDARIYQSYTHFDGDLVHDPTLGLLSDDDISDGDNGDTGDSIEDTETGGLNYPIVLTGVFILVAIPIIRRKMRQ